MGSHGLALGSWVLDGFMVQAHLLLPILFPEPPSYPLSGRE